MSSTIFGEWGALVPLEMWLSCKINVWLYASRDGITANTVNYCNADSNPSHWCQ